MPPEPQGRSSPTSRLCRRDAGRAPALPQSSSPCTLEASGGRGSSQALFAIAESPFRLACPPLNVNRSFSSPTCVHSGLLSRPFFSFVLSAPTLFVLSLRLQLPASFDLRLLLFVCFVFSFFIFSFPFLLSLPTASTSRFRFFHPLLCSISFSLLLVVVYSLVFFPRISLWTPDGRCVPPPLVLPQCSSQFARRRTGPGAPPSLRDPARPAGTRARGVGPDRRRAPSQAGYLSPAVLSALRDRRLWLGSEEPGQLLLIKSQLWFLSGEPLSKGTDTKLRGLTHFLR